MNTLILSVPVETDNKTAVIRFDANNPEYDPFIRSFVCCLPIQHISIWSGIPVQNPMEHYQFVYCMVFFLFSE